MPREIIRFDAIGEKKRYEEAVRKSKYKTFTIFIRSEFEKLCKKEGVK